MRGDEIWMQFLSEPSGGSDVAAALTTAMRDGDEWVVNGSKIWTTGAWFSDYGLCLLRTNWDVPKHRGLSVFIIKIHQPNIELHRIEMINGSREFCQEFMTDLRVPDSDRVGDVDQGWTVGTRWMFHERNAVGGGSPYVSGPAFRFGGGTDKRDPLIELARKTGRLNDARARDLIGEARTLNRAGAELQRRLAEGMGAGVFPDSTAAIARMMGSVVGNRNVNINLELSGSSAAAANDGDIGSGAGMTFPDAPGGLHRWRNHRDGTQQRQRARARHAAGSDARPGVGVPRCAQGSARKLIGARDVNGRSGRRGSRRGSGAAHQPTGSAQRAQPGGARGSWWRRRSGRCGPRGAGDRDHGHRRQGLLRGHGPS